MLLFMLSNVKQTLNLFPTIKLLEKNEKIYNIPDIEFDSYITMPSSDFQTYISDLANVSSEIEFRSNMNNLSLKSTGDFAEQTIKINETNNEISNSDEQLENNNF